jgi:hypothetical protein
MVNNKEKVENNHKKKTKIHKTIKEIKKVLMRLYNRKQVKKKANNRKNRIISHKNYGNYITKSLILDGFLF